MQCVILAAGRGTRMDHLCDDCPKPMLPIQGKPKLAYTIEELPSVIDEVILIVGYLKEQIMDFFGEEYDGKKIRYVEQKELNGTGGAVHLVKDMVQGKFLVVMGDDLYMKCDLERMMQYDLSVLVVEVEEAQKYAVLEVDEDNTLKRIVEVPHTSSSHLVNTAAYVLSEDFFTYPLVPKSLGSSEVGLPQTLVQMQDKHDIYVEKATDWFPIGTPEALEEAQIKIKDFITHN